MWWPQPSTWPWILFLFLLLFIYLIGTEIQSQDCDDRLCYNTTSQAVLEDHPRAIIDKIVTTLRVNHNPVEWRKALLIGLLVSFLVILILGCPLTLKNFVLVGLVIFILAYFASTWTNWIYWREIDNVVERQLIYFRSKL